MRLPLCKIRLRWTFFLNNKKRLIHDFGDLPPINLSGLQNPTGFPPKAWMSLKKHQ